jgi:hypothetical protein
LSIVKILDDVTEWAKQNICSKIELKVPPKNGEPNDFEYEYQLAQPVAFTMYVPAEDKLPKNIPSAFPSLCVRFMKGEDDLTTMKGRLGIQLLLSAWTPGTYREDYISKQPAEKQLERNGGGWRDIWNFTDIAVRAVESTTSIAGYKIDRSVPVEFGPLTEQEAIPDYYPFWFTWVTFQLTYPLMRNIDDVQEFL